MAKNMASVLPLNILEIPFPDDVVKSVLHVCLKKVIYKGKIKPLEFFVIKNGSYGIIGSPAMFIMGVEISFRRPFGGIM